MNFICYGWTSTSAGGKTTPSETQTGKNQVGNSELPGSLEDSDNDYCSSKKRILNKNLRHEKLICMESFFNMTFKSVISFKSVSLEKWRW